MTQLFHADLALKYWEQLDQLYRWLRHASSAAKAVGKLFQP